MELEVEIEGLEELTKKRLDKLVYHIDKDTMEPIIRAGAQKMRRYISAAAPRGKTGNLQRGQIAKLLPRKNEYPTVGLVRPNWKVAPHSELVEKGHRIAKGGKLKLTAGDRSRGKRQGTVTGVVKPHPYFWPTYESHKAEIQREILNKIIAEVEKV
jgi:hypothetical protein